MTTTITIPDFPENERGYRLSAERIAHLIAEYVRYRREGQIPQPYLDIVSALSELAAYRRSHEPLPVVSFPLLPIDPQDEALVDNLVAKRLAGTQGASRDASPADLVGALQDVVHTDPGPVRAGKAVKSPNPVICERCGLNIAGLMVHECDGIL